VVAIRTPDGGWEVPPKPDRMCAEGDRVQVLVPTGRIEEVHALAAG
jgi:hypothetical protein